MAKRAKRASKAAKPYPVEQVKPLDLKPHPNNYRGHPPEQVAEIVESIRQHGCYRNIVVSKDGYILAGHGVVLASIEMKLAEVPVIRVPVEHTSPAALKILAGDNELGQLADDDERKLADLLKDVLNKDGDLRGTGYDPETLAALVLVTRPASEVPDKETATHWVGVPGYENKEDPYKLIIAFESATARDEFMKKQGAGPEHVIQKLAKATTITWPLRERVKKHETIVVNDARSK